MLGPRWNVIEHVYSYVACNVVCLCNEEDSQGELRARLPIPFGFRLSRLCVTGLLILLGLVGVTHRLRRNGLTWPSTSFAKYGVFIY